MPKINAMNCLMEEYWSKKSWELYLTGGIKLVVHKYRYNCTTFYSADVLMVLDCPAYFLLQRSNIGIILEATLHKWIETTCDTKKVEDL